MMDEKEANLSERIRMVKAMEFICRQINDENVFECWRVNGVADGDLDYGDLTVWTTEPDAARYAEDDERFADLMDTFLWVMKKAGKSGGLYCDDVLSKEA